MKQLWKLVLAIATASMLAACSSTPEQATPVEDRNATAATGATSGSSGTSTSGMGNQSGASGSNLQGNNMSGNPLKDPRSPLSRREIFYDYDSFVVKDEYKPLLEAHAAYLKSNRNARVTVEGNTDERGSREYNLALGQKRSESVKRVLTLLGVNEAQIETVSFGEEKPRNPGHDEASWAENRRVDVFVVHRPDIE